MSKDQNRKKNFSGYMTVYLTLVMTVLLSICLTLTEGARSSAIKMESEIAVAIASDSVMAEYNRELLKQYNIFAVEDSYGSDKASLSNMEDHLSVYLTKNLSGDDIFLGRFFYRDFLGLSPESAEVQGAMFLSDHDGKVFRRRAYEAIKDDIGLTMMSEMMEYAHTIETGGFEDQDLTERMYGLQSEIDAAQQEARERKIKEAEEAARRREEKKKKQESKEDGSKADDTKTEEDDKKNEEEYEEPEEEIIEVNEPYNPTSEALAKMNPMVLFQFVEDVDDLSQNVINTSELFSGRKKAGYINAGNLRKEDESFVEEAVESFVFCEYLMKYMGNYRDVDENDALRYQIEYIIAGQDADIDNLGSVIGLIFGIRFAECYAYISGDEEKRSEAKIMGTIIAVLTYTEEFIDQYTELILLLWACSEAQRDVRCLLAGSKIEMFKTYENWFTTIQNMLTPMSSKDTTGDETGLTYEDYLRLFVLILPNKLVASRAFDIIESDVRMTSGNSGFRIDSCVDTVQLQMITYSSFGYTNTYRVKKRYE